MGSCGVASCFLLGALNWVRLTMAEWLVGSTKHDIALQSMLVLVDPPIVSFGVQGMLVIIPAKWVVIFQQWYSSISNNSDNSDHHLCTRWCCWWCWWCSFFMSVSGVFLRISTINLSRPHQSLMKGKDSTKKEWFTVCHHWYPAPPGMYETL